MKRFWIYALLIAFSVLILPKELIHHHNDDGHSHEYSNSEEGTFDVDCFSCDFDISNLATAVVTSNDFRFSIISTKVTNWSFDYIQFDLNYSSSRAPPIMV